MTDEGRRAWRPVTAGNPVRGIQRNTENKRERYLDGDEMKRLFAALNASNRRSADVVRLALLTGARRGEILSMRWCDLDLAKGVWTKPSAHTKTKKVHRVPLSAPVRQLLAGLAEKAPKLDGLVARLRYVDSKVSRTGGTA